MLTYNDVKEYYEEQSKDFYFNLPWSHVQEVLESQDVKSAIALIDQESVRAYRREESAAGII
jgi:hypothetical protein